MTTTEQQPSRCPMCGEVVGVYEPAISVTADGDRRPGHHRGHEVAIVAVYHRGCLEPDRR